MTAVLLAVAFAYAYGRHPSARSKAVAWIAALLSAAATAWSLRRG